jgi:hypothetical protein
MNQLHQPSACVPKDICEDNSVWSPDFPLTLVNFASLLGRDAIVAALLRAVRTNDDLFSKHFLWKWDHLPCLNQLSLVISLFWFGLRFIKSCSSYFPCDFSEPGRRSNHLNRLCSRLVIHAEF